MSDAMLAEGRDLTALTKAGTLPEPLGRDAEAASLVQLLSRGSVLVTGVQGVGKTAVIHAAVHALARGAEPVRVVEWSTALMMSGTKYLGEWQSRVSELIDEAAQARAVLYVSDAFNLATEGTTVHSTASVLDALRPHLASGRLRLIAEASPEQLFRMQQVPSFTTLFSELPVRPLDDARADAVVAAVAARDGLADDAVAVLRDLTARFLPARPRPGPELSLLARTVAYASEKRALGEPVALDGAFVAHVFTIYSGLPRFVVSRTEPVRAHDVRAWFRERIVGQEEAIEAVIESIALYKAGLHDPTRPIGTFLFVGPTGVGKTELARSLARFMFGSDARLLRFDMSEFKDYHAFEMLLGNPREPARAARLLDPVRAQPFQVVLLDEIEKAHPNVFDLLLQVLDEGRLTAPSGELVGFRNTFFIVTSNVGASVPARGLGFEPAADDGPGDLRRALEQEFRPELLNRFQHILRFQPLSAEQVRRIARRELSTILTREGITRRNLVVDVADEALELALLRGYDPRYGARALKREIQRTLVLPLALVLMERDLAPGTLLRLTAQDGAVRVRVVETEASREARAERAPIKLEGHKPVTRAELELDARELAERARALAAAVDAPALARRRGELSELRAKPDLYRKPQAAADALRELERCARVLGRVERLEERAEDLAQRLDKRAPSRDDLARAAEASLSLRADLEVARRELVRMGEEGEWDAVVMVQPLGTGGRPARDLLHGTYAAWARAQRARVELLCEPLADDEPVTMLIQAAYAHGLLRHEAGLHRLRSGETTSVARVRVWPWTDQRADVPFGEHAALKATGQLGGRVRSRLWAGALVLQNGRTLADNRELAAEHYGAFLAAPAPSEEIVRRYDREPPLVRDALLELSTGRWDALAPASFHELLGRRVDALRPG